MAYQNFFSTLTKEGKSMKRYVSLSLSIIMLTLFALATPSSQAKPLGTDIAGGLISASTTWTLANSPYVIKGTVRVQGVGTVLTIEPGVTVKFEKGMMLWIKEGTLIARGTSAAPIRFTANSATVAGSWGYIHFDDTSIDATFDSSGYTGGSILQYATVEYAGTAGTSSFPAIKLTSSSPFLDNLTVQNNISDGISGGSNTTLRVTNSTITDNGGSFGITVSGSSSGGDLQIVGNTVSRNQGYGIAASHFN